MPTAGRRGWPSRRPGWSLLVGLIDGAKLRVYRLRVTRCGRILGRSDDALEIFHDDVGTKPVHVATASLAPDGGSLCVLSRDYETPPQALQLPLRSHANPSPLPILPEQACCPISAAGHIWAPCIRFDFKSRTFILVMLRLLQEDGRSRWEQAGDPVVGPIHDHLDIFNCGRFLQGYAVLPVCDGDRTLILVSLKKYGIFFTFDCSTSGWNPVDTTAYTSKFDYVPIMGHGVYIQEDETVYMLYENTIYACKIHCDDEEEDHPRLRLELPVKIDSVSRFSCTAGYSYLAHLGGRLMCSVWISGGGWEYESCSCPLHAIVSTFHLPAQGGIEVLHSTCRRIDMLPDPFNHQSCFLQEYKDEESSKALLLQLEEDPISNSPAPLLLECCRWNLLPEDQRPPRVEPVKPVKPAIAHINRDVFIIFQGGAQSSVYKTNVMDDSVRRNRRQACVWSRERRIIFRSGHTAAYC